MANISHDIKLALIKYNISLKRVTVIWFIKERGNVKTLYARVYEGVNIKLSDDYINEFKRRETKHQTIKTAIRQVYAIVNCTYPNAEIKHIFETSALKELNKKR